MTATLGNSVYLGTKSSATASKSATAEAIQLAQDQGDTEALASDEYKNAATDEAKNAIKQKYEAKYIHAANIAAMDKDGISAGVTNYDTDYTYGNDSSCNYAGSQADGIVTVGSKDATRRIQNVSAGLVGPNSTDAVNGSQLYALTRQIRFGGDNSSFGTTAADDQNVVARGSNEAISITGGSDAVTSSNVDGKTTNTVDTAKLTGNNIAVVADADKNALHVQLASNLKDLNTAQLGSGSGESYKETIKLDGTGTNGGQMTLAGADGTVKTTLDTTGLTIANGPKFTSSGIDAASQKIHNVTAGTDDADAVNVKQLQSARTLLTQGTNITLADTDADGHHTYTVNVDNLAVKANKEAAKSVTLKNGLTFNDGTNTTASVEESGAVSYNLNQEISLKKVTTGNSTLDTEGLTVSGGPKIAASGIDAGNRVISGVANGSNDTDAVNVSQLKAIQSDVDAGWTIKGKDPANADVNANIGKGKTVTYDNGNYIKSVVTKDDSTGNATVKVDVTTGTFGSGTGDKAGTVTSTANGLATTQDVANAINSASISVVADDTPDNKTSVKAGDTIHFAKDDNLTLTQDGTQFTYGLNKEISISQVTTSDATNGSTVQDAKGITTTDAAGNTYIQNGQGITLTPSDKIKSPVKLTNTGLNNGGNKITGVGKGTDDADAVNVSQLKEVQAQVGSGWQLAGNDGQKVADIGAGKKVSFTGSQYLTANTESAGTDAANVTYGLKTKALTAADGKVSSINMADDGLVTAKNVAETINQTYWKAASGKSGSGSQTDETANVADKQISAGDTVIFNAGNNLSLVQNGASFTYGLQTDLTGMNTIHFGGTLNNGNWLGGLLIGKQAGSGANTADGNYITGLSNTKWDRATISENNSMAAIEGELKQAIENITTSGGGTGGFGLQADTGDSIMQDLRKTIQIKDDGEGSQDGNIKTSNEGGVLRIRLNKTLNLSEDGSVQVGSSKMSNGVIQLGEDADANKILMDSAKGMATVGGVTIEMAQIRQYPACPIQHGKLQKRRRMFPWAVIKARLRLQQKVSWQRLSLKHNYGCYHDANAVAIGAYYHPNDTTILSIGGSMGGGENMVNAGITWKMGRSGHEQRAAQPVVTHPVQAAPVVQQAAPARPAPVATPAPVVTPAPVTTPALTQILARQTAILEKLAQNQSQAARPTAVAHGDDIFPDVPENHWAYAYVAKLEKAGALKGFKRPAVLKSPMMTRDDFASVLYTAMANGATTNPALNGDDSLNRLAQEFKAELKDVKP